MHLNPKLEAERCANPRSSEAAERWETVSPSMVGRGEHEIGATADTSAQVNKNKGEHATMTKGNMHEGAGTVTRTHTWAGSHAQGLPLPG